MTRDLTLFCGNGYAGAHYEVIALAEALAERGIGRRASKPSDELQMPRETAAAAFSDAPNCLRCAPVLSFRHGSDVSYTALVALDDRGRHVRTGGNGRRVNICQ